MKKRNGFVSNSSSSSFIIDDTKVSIGEIAIDMLRTIHRDYAEDKINRRIPSDFDHVTFMRHNKNNCNILIPWSYGEETWIFRRPDGRIGIETSNNHSWDFCTNSEWIEPPEVGHRPVNRTFLNLEDFKIYTRNEFEHKKWGYKLIPGLNWRETYE